LSNRLRAALQSPDGAGLSAVADATARDARDRFDALAAIYALHRAPLVQIGDAVWFQHHPAISELKARLEADWIAELDALPVPHDNADVSTSLKSLAARDRLPDLYRWVADEATWDEVREFLALEGGPDADFDDLVATCQIGIDGVPKVEMARNYWDEIGNGEPTEVHTTLYRRMAAAVGIRAVPADQQPLSALTRGLLGGLLSTNRSLQPEMIGALGLIELQAGPRCRLVLQAFDRCGAPQDAYPFYRVHAEVDPRHGMDWVANVVEPICDAHPDWGQRILRGAAWRAGTNAEFFRDVSELLIDRRRAA
jgi:hypothetical protein